MFTARTTERRGSTPRHNVVALSRDTAEDYMKLVARMGNYSLYCRAPEPSSCHCLPTAENSYCREINDRADCRNTLSETYQSKHNAWKELELRAERAYPRAVGGDDSFDHAQTAAFNVTSLWFINHQAHGPTSPICEAVKTEFDLVMQKNVSEVLSYLSNGFEENYEPRAVGARTTPTDFRPETPIDANVPGEMYGPFGPE